MFVRDCMTHNPITLHLDSDPLAGIALCKGGRFRHLPVVDEEERLVGVVSRNNLEQFLAKKDCPGIMERQHYVRQVDIQHVPLVRPDFPVEEAARLIVENKVTCLPVMEGEKLVGIVTETDLLEAMLEIFSGSRKGIRLTALVLNVKGSLASVSAAIAKEGGNILSLNIFEGSEPSNWGCTLKATEISKEALLKALEPVVLEILDVREI